MNVFIIIDETGEASTHSGPLPDGVYEAAADGMCQVIKRNRTDGVGTTESGCRWTSWTLSCGSRQMASSTSRCQTTCGKRSQRL